MRASRLLSILLLLQARGRMTAEALAREFEVSVRTIYRDVDQLSAADVPIYADRGPSGGFQLLDGYRTKLTGLSPAEAETLSLAGLPGPAAQLGLADVLKAGVWYLVAQVGDQIRTYRVSNIIDLAVTEESFKRPKDFDLTRFWVTSSRTFETSVYHSNATLRVTARGFAKLDVLGSLVAQAAAETATPADADGWLSVTIPIESVERAASGLIALGADAEVVEPSELRERLAATVQELVRLYAPTQLTRRRPRQRKRR